MWTRVGRKLGGKKSKFWKERFYFGTWTGLKGAFATLLAGKEFFVRRTLEKGAELRHAKREKKKKKSERHTGKKRNTHKILFSSRKKIFWCLHFLLFFSSQRWLKNSQAGKDLLTQSWHFQTFFSSESNREGRKRKKGSFSSSDRADGVAKMTEREGEKREKYRVYLTLDFLSSCSLDFFSFFWPRTLWLQEAVVRLCFFFPSVEVRLGFRSLTKKFLRGFLAVIQFQYVPLFLWEFFSLLESLPYEKKSLWLVFVRIGRFFQLLLKRAVGVYVWWWLTENQ